jgi:hypothetical protein
MLSELPADILDIIHREASQASEIVSTPDCCEHVEIEKRLPAPLSICSDDEL